MRNLRIATVFVVVIAQGAFTAMGKTHKPEFSFKKGRIYDGDRQIVRIAPRKPNTTSKVFTSVVLRPGGKEVLEWIWMRCDEPKDYSLAEGSTPQRLILTGNLQKHRDIAVKIEAIVTYDEKLNSYVYDFSWERRLKKRPASWKNTPELRDPESPRHNWYGASLEYCNIGQAGRSQSHWEYMLYQARSGEWLKVPLNHFITLQQLHLEFKKGGAQFGYFGADTPYVNPVIELMENTADDTLVGICDAGYDYHLRMKHTQGRRKYKARFRVYCFGQEKGRALIRKAEFRYTEAEMKDWQRPALRFRKGSHFITDFERGNCQISPISVAIWRPFGDISKTRWLRNEGYKSKGCIRIGQEDTLVKCHWAIACNCGLWPTTEPGKTYKLSAWIKTENLRGKGAYIETDIPFVMPEKGKYKFTRGKKRITSRRLTGTNGWTKVELEIPGVEKALLDLRLCHEGKGVSWFDNVMLEGDVLRYDEVTWDDKPDRRFRKKDRDIPEAKSRGNSD
ncbi:MAG: hypothetical protein KAV00_14915 [Phycisphaerae bacterium]|nr:hypothetical protein [Phycisphaerae bacterium]